MMESGAESVAPYLFARLTAELEDTATIAVKGQSARNTRHNHLKLARRVRAGLTRSSVLVDRIFERLGTVKAEGDHT